MNHIDMMRLAESVAKQSVCKRAQVGAVVKFAEPVEQVEGIRVRAVTGHNHNVDPHNWLSGNRCCEGEDGKTLPTVIHAEDSALRSAYGYTSGAVLYVTRQPCIHCARLITAAGIKAVYYRDKDDKDWGLRWLAWHGVEVDSGWILGQVQESWAEHSGQSGVVSHG